MMRRWNESRCRVGINLLDGCAWLCCGSVNELSRSYVDGSDTGDCLTIDYPNMISLCYYGSAQKNKGMWGIRG